LLDLIPKLETNEQSLQSAYGWQNSVSIHKKHAVGTLASSKYDEQTSVFNKVHASIESKSNILPLSSYYGAKPDPAKDPFDRRRV